MATLDSPPGKPSALDSSQSPASSPADLSYEQAIERLEGLIERIESGEVGLEESLKQYETGMTLIGRCRSILAGAEQKVAELTMGENDELTVAQEVGEGDAVKESRLDADPKDT